MRKSVKRNVWRNDLTASLNILEKAVDRSGCYSEFNDIIESVAEMDADVISIETSRSRRLIMCPLTF